MWQNQKFLCAELCPCLCFPNTGKAKKQMFNLRGGGVLSLGFALMREGSGGCCWSGQLAAAESQGKQNRAKNT